jgi:hypothetical protein
VRPSFHDELEGRDDDPPAIFFSDTRVKGDVFTVLFPPRRQLPIASVIYASARVVHLIKGEAVEGGIDRLERGLGDGL